MNGNSNWDSQQLESQLQSLATTVNALAQQEKNNCQGLLILLRTLEQLHRDIREQMFEPSLPNTRKDLYNLLRDIDETGGWPYIERMKLRTILTNWPLESNASEEPPSSTSEGIDVSDLNY